MVETDPVRRLDAANMRGLADAAAGRTAPAEEVLDRLKGPICLLAERRDSD